MLKSRVSLSIGKLFQQTYLACGNSYLIYVPQRLAAGNFEGVHFIRIHYPKIPRFTPPIDYSLFSIDPF